MATRKDEDFLNLLASQCYLGTNNLNNQMKPYVDHRSKQGVYILNMEETWQKIKLAARAIAAIDNLEDVLVISSRVYGQRAAMKFAQQTGCSNITTSRWVPGTFTNQNTKKFQEPRLLIVTDTRQDHQAIVEASYMNIPCIALCDSDSPLSFVDIAIPCNNRSTESISMVYWMLAREVLILTRRLAKEEKWNVLVDMFYYQKEEVKKPDVQVEDDLPNKEDELQEEEQEDAFNNN